MASAEEFINSFEEKAESIKDKLLRSKKYRAGIAALAQMSVGSNDMTYLLAAVTFTDKIIDEHDRSKAIVDIVRGTARVARNTSDPQLVQKALDLSEHTEKGHDRSHALQGVVAAMVEVGASEVSAVEEARTLADTIEYDTYRSSAWRSIARTLLAIEDKAGAQEAAKVSMDIICTSRAKEHPIFLASAYVDLSEVFLDMGQTGTARWCIDKAEGVAAGIVNEFGRSSIYRSIAVAQVRMGARTGDRKLFEDAVRSYGQVSREFYRTHTRKTLKNVLMNFGEKVLVDGIDDS